MSVQKTEISKFARSNHAKNMDLSIGWNRRLLEPFGVWPLSYSNSGVQRCVRWLKYVVSYFLISLICVPLGLFGVFEVEGAYNKLKLFGPMSFFLMVYMKYFNLINNITHFRDCIEQIESDWKNTSYSEDRDIMVENAIFGRRLVKICCFFTYSGFVFYYVATPIATGRVTDPIHNLTFVPTPFPVAQVVVDTRHSPANEIFIVGQFFGGFVLHGIAVGACTYAAVFAVHACGQVKILHSWLQHLTAGRTDMSESVDDRIANIVRQHVRILKFLSATEEVLQQISFVEFTGCTLNLCLLGYYILMEWETHDIATVVTYVLILVSFGFNIFIFCYIGELIAEQCSRVGEVAYMIDWYNLQGKKKQCLIMIIAMSNSSSKLTAGGMVELSLSTFGDVRIQCAIYVCIFCKCNRNVYKSFKCVGC
ncbi:odorant receptor 22a-like isoform X2 [Halictus rubicundus]|uniref:odorant receptor 22a-like isoform X2 n=1 Tax=Halictus rubicundus TaxID=77578 RepID=UPI004035CF15